MCAASGPHGAGRTQLVTPVIRASRERVSFSELQFAAVRYHLIVIGEAVHHLPESLRRDPTWRPFLELRNHLAHEYFRLNHARIAELIGEPLANLERVSRDLLRET